MIKHRVDRRRAIALLAAWPAQAQGFPALTSEADRRAFRLWFCWLAEMIAWLPEPRRPREITDCSALLRFAFRESLHRHDEAWARALGLQSIPAIPEIRHPPQASLFETVSGEKRRFADAAQLMRHNTFFLGRDLALAQPADLLFFSQSGAERTYHSMIFLGQSAFETDRGPFLVYHTGPDGSNPGEVLRPTVVELLNHREPRWRPVAGNPNFLGVHRWNLLRESW